MHIACHRLRVLRPFQFHSGGATCRSAGRSYLPPLMPAEGRVGGSGTFLNA